MKILFVCLGNICRSPAAEGVFSQKILSSPELSKSIQCDSCGTGDWHIGQLPDPRMRAAGTLRGYNFTHRARQLSKNDYEKFELIIAMDDSNKQNILAKAPPQFNPSRIKLFTEFCSQEFSKYKNVPDPYYGNEKDFETTLDIIENACDGLIEYCKTKN